MTAAFYMCTQSITYVVKVFNTIQFCKIFSVGNYLLLLGPVNSKILKNDHSCKNALRKPDMFSLLQIITLNSMSTKFFFRKLHYLCFYFCIWLCFQALLSGLNPKFWALHLFQEGQNFTIQILDYLQWKKNECQNKMLVN